MDIRETIGKTMTRLFSTSSERYVKKRRDFNAEINALEAEYSQLTDEQLREKSEELRAHIRQNQDHLIGPSLRKCLRELTTLPEEARKPAKKTLTDQLRQCCDEIIIEAFALVRQASDRHPCHPRAACPRKWGLALRRPRRARACPHFRKTDHPEP